MHYEPMLYWRGEDGFFIIYGRNEWYVPGTALDDTVKVPVAADD